MIDINFQAQHSSGQTQHVNIAKIEGVDGLGIDEGFQITVLGTDKSASLFLTEKQFEELHEAIGLALSIGNQELDW